MSESLPKVRSSLSTITGIASNSCNFAKPWTTARCHRLLRPLSSKLQALRKIVQSNPSVTSGNASRPKPKHDPTDPDALFVEVIDKAVGKLGGIGGARTRAKPRRTYAGTGGGGSRSSALPPLAVAPTGTTSSTSANDSYLTIWGDPINPPESQPPPPLKRSHQPKSQDPNNPYTLLHSLKTHIHPSIFSIYLGIYTSLESILLSTNLPHKTKVLPLRTLAARKIAHCILATADEVESDDTWYDATAELGCGGEYLRDVVRWHAIELIREAITDGLMKGREGGNGGIGMAGVLVGLCRSSGAEPEAQLLLQTMFDLQQVISSSDHPPIRTLQTFWLSDPKIIYRILAANFPVTCSNPSWLGSTDIRKFLLLDLDDNSGLELLTTRAFEAAFGIWGDEHIDALFAQRRKASKRKGALRASRSINEVEDATRKAAAIMPYNIATKAENTVLKTTKALVLLSLQDPSSKAIGILQQLVRGFLVQDPGVRSSTEDVWGENWPVAGKIAILLQGLGSNAEDDNGIMDELARSLEDVCSSGGKEALRSLASFVADCYKPLYKCAPPLGREDPVQLVTNRLLKLAVATHNRFSLPDEEERSELAKILPETPRIAPGKKMVTFTPGKPALAPHQEVKETKRYLVAQLALHIAVKFSLTDAVKSNATWIDWLGRFEHKVISLKIQTPGRVKSILQSLNIEDELEGNAGSKQKKKEIGGNEKRKGWRFEEGLDLWVAVGATPGRKEERKKKGVFMECVEVEMEDDNDWRNGYDVFASDIGEAAISDDELMEGATELSSEYCGETDVSDRPVTPTSSIFSANNDDDAEFYSNLRTTPLRTLRRSPRGTARIKRSLTCFSAIISTPMFSRLRTPVQVRSSGLRRQFDFSVIVGSSPVDSPVVPSTEQKLGGGQGFWEDGEDDEEGLRAGYSSPVLRKNGRGDNFSEDEKSEGEAEEGEEGGLRAGYSSPVLGDMRKGNDLSEDQKLEDEAEEQEEEEEGGVSILNMGSDRFNSLCSPSKVKRRAPVLSADLMEIDSVSNAEDAEKEQPEIDAEEEQSEGDAEEEQSEEEQEAEEVSLEDELSIATVISLPPSPSPPPSPPPRPRRPKRTSLGALKSMININDTVASTPKHKDVMKLLEQGKKLTPSEKRCLRRKKVRMLKAAERKRAEVGLSEDELGM